MKPFISFTFLCLISISCFSQEISAVQKVDYSGNLYFYWGWHRAWFGNSDITFKGDGHHFTIKDVKAVDKQIKFNVDPYFHPKKLTVPQTNFRVGYFINNKYDISFGFDHMKYVVVGNQYVKVSGEINNTGTAFDGVYSDAEIPLTQNFLKFEHTNGLNFINVEFRRSDNILEWRNITLNHTEGLGTGVVIPKTNSTLINYGRHDEFHLAGYGFNALAGLNITFLDKFFVQSEFKGGFINMPDIRSSANESDKASQHFYYAQLNIVFGAIIHLHSRKPEETNKVQ